MLWPDADPHSLPLVSVSRLRSSFPLRVNRLFVRNKYSVNKYSVHRSICIHYDSLFLSSPRISSSISIASDKTLKFSACSIAIANTCVSRRERGCFPPLPITLITGERTFIFEAILNRYDSDTCCGHSKGVINFIRNSDDTLGH